MNSFATLLGSYGASLSAADVKILREIFSQDGSSSILKYNPFIWGEAAGQYYSSISDTRYALFRIPKSNHVMGQYKKDQMMKTLLQFPLDLPLDPNAIADNRPDLYDPRFILLSLYHLLGPENAVNVNQIIRSQGLSIVLVGTSSNIADMRHLSYLTLERFLFHLEASKSSSAVYFWTTFIECFRASISTVNQQMPFLLTSILVQTIAVIDNPKDSVFYALKDFVTLKPKFDTDHISLLFINLLTSKDLEWKKCQRMVLNLLAYGVKSQIDFDICRKNGLIAYILSLFTSKWADWLDKILIIKFLKNCTVLPQALEILVIENGLIVWLSGVITSSYNTISESQKNEITSLVTLINKKCKLTNLSKNCYKQPLSLIKSIM